MNAQPRESIELVKKSPRRRSWPVATHVVPPWQTLSSWIGRPTGSTVSIDGVPEAASLIDAARIETLDCWQSRSTSLSVWYQTTLTRPASPAAIHGQNARAPTGAATVIGGDHVLPRSREYAYWIWLGSGLPDAPLNGSPTGLSAPPGFMS